MRLRARTHTGEVEQPNQLYLKEVGSLNMGAPACLSMHARCTSLPSKSWTSVFSHDAASGCFIALVHVPCDIMNDVTA